MSQLIRNAPHNRSMRDISAAIRKCASAIKANKREQFEAEKVPQAKNISALLARKKSEFEQLRIHKLASELVRVNVKIRGPIAIANIGDPHLDDDGCDLATIERHAEIVDKTYGMFAATVGDPTNNWVGDLVRLWSEQSTSEEDANLLLEWFINLFDWLYFLDGNHGAWNGQGNLIKHLLSHRHVGRHGAMSARLELVFPNGRRVRVNSRHEFKGGPAQAVKDGWRDHIVICGHKHRNEYEKIRDPMTGTISHAIRVASYEVYSRMAEKNNYPNENISPCVTTIINPDARNEIGLVTVIDDLETAADFLTWMRKKGGYK